MSLLKTNAPDTLRKAAGKSAPNVEVGTMRVNQDTVLLVSKHLRINDPSREQRGLTLPEFYCTAPAKWLSNILGLKPDVMRRVLRELNRGVPVSFVYTNDGALYGGGGSRTVFAIEVRK